MLPSGRETAVALKASPQLWYLPSSERVKTAAQTGTHTLTKSYRYFLIAAGENHSSLHSSHCEASCAPMDGLYTCTLREH